MSSPRDSTQKQYDLYIGQWLSFCSERHVNVTSPPLGTVIEFLTTLFCKGLSYSGFNTARSALSSFVILGDHLAGQHSLVTRFMKGIFNKGPCFPKTSVTWDTNVVLNFLKNLPTSNLKNLTLKAVMLAALLTGQRTQTVHWLSIQNMTVTAEFYKFRIGDIIKQTRPGNHLSEIELPAHPHDKRLCIVSILNVYLSRTKDVRGKTTKLFLSYTKPFKTVSKSAIAR